MLVGSRFTVRPDAAPPGSFTGSRFALMSCASVRVHGSEFMVGSRVKTTELVHEPCFLSYLLHTDTVREPQFANHPRLDSFTVHGSRRVSREESVHGSRFTDSGWGLVGSRFTVGSRFRRELRGLAKTKALKVLSLTNARTIILGSQK